MLVDFIHVGLHLIIVKMHLSLNQLTKPPAKSVHLKKKQSPTSPSCTPSFLGVSIASNGLLFGVLDSRELKIN